jgi:hypothetical protein
MSDAPHTRTKIVIPHTTAEELFLSEGWGGGRYTGFDIADRQGSVNARPLRLVGSVFCLCESVVLAYEFV